MVDIKKHSDTYITAGAKDSTINEASDYMEIYLEEEQKTETYQETLNNDIVSIENIEKTTNIIKNLEGQYARL